MGLLDHRPIQFDLGLHLQVLLDQLGGRQRDQRRACLHPVADVYVPLLDKAGNLRVERGTLVRSDHPRLLDSALHGPPLGVDHLDGRVEADRGRGRRLRIGAAARQAGKHQHGEPDTNHGRSSFRGQKSEVRGLKDRLH